MSDLVFYYYPMGVSIYDATNMEIFKGTISIYNNKLSEEDKIKMIFGDYSPYYDNEFKLMIAVLKWKYKRGLMQ